MSLRGNVLLSQNKRLGGLRTFVMRIIKPFSLIISTLFSIISCPLFPYVTLPQRESSGLYVFFSFHSMQKFSFNFLLRAFQCLPGGEGARGEFEETLSCPSENPWNGFLLVMGIPGDYSTRIWWQGFCLGRQHFRFVREFWCLNKPMKTQYQSCWVFPAPSTRTRVWLKIKTQRRLSLEVLMDQSPVITQIGLIHSCAYMIWWMGVRELYSLQPLALPG